MAVRNEAGHQYVRGPVTHLEAALSLRNSGGTRGTKPWWNRGVCGGIVEAQGTFPGLPHGGGVNPPRVTRRRAFLPTCASSPTEAPGRDSRSPTRVPTFSAALSHSSENAVASFVRTGNSFGKSRKGQSPGMTRSRRLPTCPSGRSPARGRAMRFAPKAGAPYTGMSAHRCPAYAARVLGNTCGRRAAVARVVR
jgi:hypothetical protein